MERITTKIFIVRRQKIMLDRDLAELYGVASKRLNERVRRNAKRFPDDFIFQLTAEEKEEVVANCDHFLYLKYSKVLPLAFTEHGAINGEETTRGRRKAGKKPCHKSPKD